MSLSALAESKGVEYIDCGDGHIQLKGIMTVNYYPDSKFKTAYINGMKGSIKNVSESKAVELAINIPKKQTVTDERKRSYRREKVKLLKKNPFCHWCKKELTRETATIEHIIPLGLGGINNMNNYKLACEPCNIERGCDMPELKKGK